MRRQSTEGAVGAIPRHVAIIMDGNGRWARKRMLPRHAGHANGIAAVRRTVDAARDLGVEYLTVYAFSTENWRRPKLEVDNLMGLFRRYFRSDVQKLHESNVRIRVIGSRGGLAPDIQDLIAEAEAQTASNTGLNFNLAFNYSAREELAAAARAIAADAMAGRIKAEAVGPDIFANYLQSAGLPDVDLMIRTSGERRLSNFLLWQAAYAEFVFVETLWPDFGRDDLAGALAEYARRERRFGRVEATLTGAPLGRISKVADAD